MITPDMYPCAYEHPGLAATGCWPAAFCELVERDSDNLRTPEEKAIALADMAA